MESIRKAPPMFWIIDFSIRKIRYIKRESKLNSHYNSRLQVRQPADVDWQIHQRYPVRGQFTSSLSLICITLVWFKKFLK
jgi:hypothetical protein